MRGFVFSLAPWLDHIHQGDGQELMRHHPDGCVDLVVASPPRNLLNGEGHGMMSSPSGKWRSVKLRNGYDGHSEDMAHVE